MIDSAFLNFWVEVLLMFTIGVIVAAGVLIDPLLTLFCFFLYPPDFENGETKASYILDRIKDVKLMPVSGLISVVVCLIWVVLYNIDNKPLFFSLFMIVWSFCFFFVFLLFLFERSQTILKCAFKLTEEDVKVVGLYEGGKK